MTSLTNNSATTGFHIMHPHISRNKTGIHSSYYIHLTITNKTFNLLDMRREPTVKTYCESLTRFLININNTLKFFIIKSKRLLHKHILTCLQSLNNHLSVQIVASNDK